MAISSPDRHFPEETLVLKRMLVLQLFHAYLARKPHPVHGEHIGPQVFIVEMDEENELRWRATRRCAW